MFDSISNHIHSNKKRTLGFSNEIFDLSITANITIKHPSLWEGLVRLHVSPTSYKSKRPYARYNTAERSGDAFIAKASY